MKFYAFLTALVVVLCPGVCLMWIILLGAINWHDALDVSVLVAIVYMIRGMRREDRAAERAMRRVQARRWERHERSDYAEPYREDKDPRTFVQMSDTNA